MSSAEFDALAIARAAQLAGLPLDARIAGACRGSASPAALAWVAEGLDLASGGIVVDVGAGLGGPAAWFEAHYPVRVVALEPAPGARVGAHRLFPDLVVAAAAADALPVRDGLAIAALALGVVSVAPDPAALVREAARVAHRVGVIDYCPAGDALDAGGSRFLGVDPVLELLGAAGFGTVIDAAIPDLPLPPTWEVGADAADVGDDPDEAAIARAIEGGALVAHAFVARRD